MTTTASVVKCGTNPLQESNNITNSSVSVRTAASHKKYRRFLRAALCCFGTRKSSDHKLPPTVSSQTDGVSVSSVSDLFTKTFLIFHPVRVFFHFFSNRVTLIFFAVNRIRIMRDVNFFAENRIRIMRDVNFFRGKSHTDYA